MTAHESTGTTPSTPPAGRTPSRGRTAAAVVAFLAMAPVGFFYAVSGLVVPGPWLFLMWLLYLVLLAGAVGLARRRSYLVLAVPLGAGVAWWALITLGETYWGWTG